jgi:choice-of-anchor B domain-containing protein
MPLARSEIALPKTAVALALALLVAPAGARAAAVARTTSADELARESARYQADHQPPWTGRAPEHLQECINGTAGGFPCDHVDLMEYMPLASIGATGGTEANDIWGWTDPLTGNEYALVGLTDGTSFVDVTDPENPVYLGKLPTHTSSSTWRDIKTYQNYAFVVSDLNGSHGMQVFDLTRLRNVPSPPVTFTEDAWYNQIGSAHNIAIDEETGFAYIVGGSSAGAGTTCAGGLHMVNIQNPLAPAFAGCFAADGYTHDTECLVYHGPDTAHDGQEICFNSNEDTLTIVDVTNHAAPVQLSRTGYAGSGYTHQGWLTGDGHYFLIDDELDEVDFGHTTYTYVWDVSDLDAPVLVGHHASTSSSIDHNQYVKGNFVFQANYRSGLRVLRIDDLSQAAMTQIGFFDVYPADDNASFNGSWSNYPYFASGNVIVSGIEQGLFVLRPTNLCATAAPPDALAAVGNGDHRIDLTWNGSGTAGDTYTVERALGGCAGTFETIATGVPAPAYSDTSASGQVTYGYRVREADPTGACVSAPSTCAEASTTGVCTAPPAFAGLASATNAGGAACEVDLAWSAAAPFCAGPATYDVYRSPTPDFVPGDAERIATGISGTSWADFGAPSLETVYYVVRAVDVSNGSEDSNRVYRDARATGPVADGTFSTGAEPGDPILDTSNGNGPGRAPEHAGWHITDTRAHNPTHSFWSLSNSNLCDSLEGSVTLTAGQVSQLAFWTAWDIEQGWDGGVLDLSTDGGATWSRLTPNEGYPGSLTQPTGDACGLGQGTAAFTGQGHFSFAPYTVDLSSHQGQTVRLRWRYSSDGSVNYEGWYVDDIAITHAQVPGACADNVILRGDFETGDTSQWSSVVP